MLPFVSEENYAKHKAEVEKRRLRLHVLEKSCPEAPRLDAAGIMRRQRRIPDAVSMASLRADVDLHRLYFDSFSERVMIPSTAARSFFGSEAALLSSMLREGMKLAYGFVCLVRDKRGVLSVRAASDILEMYNGAVPMLAVDLCEHAYYADYGFDKERYLKAALPHLRLNVLDTNQA